MIGPVRRSDDPRTDPLTFGTVILLLALAAWLPARSAGRIDPMVLLEAE